jgi:micrococcal nuclease
MKSPKIWVVIIFLTAVSSALAGFQSENWEVPPGLTEYEVYWAINGNTIEVEGLGEVKYIGVVTPKIGDGFTEPEPFGPEAWEANRSLVEGKKVQLELGYAQRNSKGQYLAYVYTGSTFVNAYLVEAGLAKAKMVPPNFKHMFLFDRLEREARREKRGIWSLVKRS